MAGNFLAFRFGESDISTQASVRYHKAHILAEDYYIIRKEIESFVCEAA